MAYMGKEEERGTMWVYPVHRNNFTKYLDNENIENATPVDLKDWTNGNLWIKEPAYWYKGVHDWETGNDYYVVSSNAQMPAVPECKVYDYKAIKEELHPVIQHYIQFLSTWNADGSVGIEKCIYKYRQDADVTSNEYTKHRGALALSYIKIPCSGYKRIKMPLNNIGLDGRDTTDFTDLKRFNAAAFSASEIRMDAPFQNRFVYELPIRQAAVFVNSDDKVIKAVQLDPEKYPSCYKDLCVAIPEGAVYCYTSVYTRAIDELTNIVLSNSDAPEDWESEWCRVDERWIAHIPLHIEEGTRTIMYSASLNEKNIKNEPANNSSYRFAEVNSYYDNVTYEEYKDVLMMMYAYNGTFSLRNKYGMPEAQYFTGRENSMKWKSTPEKGFIGSTSKNKDGVQQDFHSYYVYPDNSGQEDRPIGNYGGYGWLSPNMPNILSNQYKGSSSMSHTKGYGIIASTDSTLSKAMTDKNYSDTILFGNGLNVYSYLGNLRYFESRNSASSQMSNLEPYSDVGYRSIYANGHCGSYVDNKGFQPEKSAISSALNIVGGRFLDILPRSVDQSLNPSTNGVSSVFYDRDIPFYNNTTRFLSFMSNSGFNSSWIWSYMTFGVMTHNNDRNSMERMYVPIFKGRIEYATSLSQFTSKEQYRFIKDENYSNFSW